jgi:hypothetical protein
MPFASHARVLVINRSSRAITFSARTEYHREPIDRAQFGYFYAAYSESNPTRFHIDHPVVHVRGRGRYIGLFLSIPTSNTGISLEGNPKFTIDSADKYYIEYTGSEDYFNGGWWFDGLTFSTPFAGHTLFYRAFYRLHVLDAIDFKYSFDFNLQHGIRSDNVEDYRTVAYYYRQTERFWASRDTIRANEHWNVSGSGYEPNVPIIARFDSLDVLFTTATNSKGEFNATFLVPMSWKLGKHTLYINDESRSDPVYVIETPSVRITEDFMPTVLKYRDTLHLTGTGFEIGERISVFLDSIPVTDSLTSIVTGNDYRFYGTVVIPNIPDRQYHLVAKGDHGGQTISSDKVTVTRVLPYEFEDLVPWASWTGGNCQSILMCMVWFSSWSKQAFAVFEPQAVGDEVSFKFFVPVKDTFDIKLILTNGSEYGIFSYSIDGENVGHFDGYKKFDLPWYDPNASDTISLGAKYFVKDTHIFTFKCLGKDTAAKKFLLGADVLVLTPTTKMPLPHGVWLDTVGEKNGIVARSSSANIRLFPNPVTSGMLYLDLPWLEPGKEYPSAQLIVTDVLGRTILSTFASASEVQRPYLLKLGDIPSGRYFVHVRANTSSGMRDITAPFVVFK